MNLYTIGQEYVSILNHFKSQDGEVHQGDMMKLRELDDLQDNIEQKAVNIAAYIKNIEAEYEQVVNARKEMQLREKKLREKSDWLTDYLKINLQQCHIQELRISPQFVIKIKECPCSVNIIDEKLIPLEFKKKVFSWSYDKEFIKKTIKNGINVSGAELIKKTRLEIK